MTKQEAIESLMDTKVYVNGKSKEIQEKLFSLGVGWVKDNEQVVINTDCPFLFIGCNGILKSNDMECFSKDPYKEVTADYILNLQWDEDEPAYNFKPFDRVLVRNGDNDIWKPSLFQSYVCSFNNKTTFYAIDSNEYAQCIPYDGNEHLKLTTNNPENNN